MNLPKNCNFFSRATRDCATEAIFDLLLLFSMVVFPENPASSVCAHYGSVSSCQLLERKFVEKFEGLLSKVPPPSSDFDKI